MRPYSVYIYQIDGSAKAPLPTIEFLRKCKSNCEFEIIDGTTCGAFDGRGFCGAMQHAKAISRYDELLLIQSPRKISHYSIELLQKYHHKNPVIATVPARKVSEKSARISAIKSVLLSLRYNYTGTRLPETDSLTKAWLDAIYIKKADMNYFLEIVKRSPSANTKILSCSPGDRVQRVNSSVVF